MISKVIVAVAVLFSSFVFVQGKYRLRQPGDFVIGQFLSLHKDSGTCADLDLEKVIEVEALVYSVKKLNTEDSSFRVGYDVIDACVDSETPSVMDVWFKKGANMSRVPVAIITNLDQKTDYFSVATKVRKFSDRAENSGNGLPLISVKRRPRIWTNTYSLTPSQETPHRAILELVKYFNWNILDVIVDDDNHEYHNFKKMAEGRGVCVLNELFVSQTDTVEATRWLRKGNSNASVVIVFASKLPRLMTELDGYASRSRNFILGTSLPGTEVRWESSMRGVLGIQQDFGDLKDFEHFLENSVLLDNWVNQTICSNVSWDNCDILGGKKTAIQASSWRGASIIDAVYGVVQARHGSGRAGGRLPKTGLQGIEAASPTGRIVSFDKNENLDRIIYEVLNFQERATEVEAVNIGEIEVSAKTELSIVSNVKIEWRSSSRPRSYCSADCPPGTRRAPWSQKSSAKCCWDCIRCELDTVSSFANSSRCLECPTGTKPTSDQTKCQPPYFDYLMWHEPFSLIMIFLLVFTICFLVYTVNLYVKKAHTPVFTRSKCASLPLLLSLFVTFVLPVLLLMKPTRTSCGAYNAMFVFSLGIPLTFLIARSHYLHNYCYAETGELRRKWFRFNPQTAVSFVLITLQLVFVVVQLSVSPVEVLTYETGDADVEYIECSSHSRSDFLPLVFLIFVLVMVFNVLHLNEESSPDDLNEVKFVSLAIFIVYFLLFVYFVAVFGIVGKKKIMIMCAMSYLVGLDFFTAIFLPKIYLILFRPERNLPDDTPLLRDDDENGKPPRMLELGSTDSPLPRLRAGQYDRTEV